MTVVRGFTIIICSAVAFGIGGGIVGRLLATLTPAYYETVFVKGQSAESLQQAGIGLGVSQGLIAGVVAGSVVVLAVALSTRKRADREPTTSA